MFLCEIGSKSFSHKGNFKCHINEKHFGKQRVVKCEMHTSSHIGSQQLDESENNQFGKGYDMQGAFDIRLKENFKLFIS